VDQLKKNANAKGMRVMEMKALGIDSLEKTEMYIKELRKRYSSKQK